MGAFYVKGKLTARGKKKFAGYILFYKPNVPIAIIEAKDNKHPIKGGIQQALGYANTLDIPCVFSSNGAIIQRTDTISQGHNEFTVNFGQDTCTRFGIG